MRIKRYYAQTEFVAQQMANIIQNISQKRTDKRIYISDLKHAFCLAHLSLYPGTSMFWKNKGRELVHQPELFVAYVTGNNDGTASCHWFFHPYTSDKTFPSDIKYEVNTKEHQGTLINLKKNVAPSEIYPSLKVSPGEKKIILESTVLYQDTYTDNNGYKPGSAKKALGYFLLDKQPEKFTTKNNDGWYYHSVVIFTPKDGLFSENPPTES